MSDHTSKSVPRAKSGSSLIEDSLARRSDVIVSTNVTLYAEYKGFFFYIITSIVFVSWVLWSVVPDHILQNSWHIEYYPDKYWSLAIPTYSLMLMLFTYIGLAVYNTEVKAVALDHPRALVDEHTVFKPKSKSKSAVKDIPISEVNEVLYDS